MAKITIKELAGRVNQTPEELLQFLRKSGVDVKYSSSSVDLEKATDALEQAGIKVPAEPSDEGPILIKKYENRRLYSTASSRHVTLDEVSELVKSGKNIRVVEVGSGRDITSEILTQILIEGGRARQLPAAFLEHLIRLQDEAVQGFFEQYLNAGVAMYMNAQQEMARFYQSFTNPRMWPFNPFMFGMQGAKPGHPQVGKQRPTQVQNEAFEPRRATPEEEINATIEGMESESDAGASISVEELARLKKRIELLEKQAKDRDFAKAKSVTARNDEES